MEIPLDLLSSDMASINLEPQPSESNQNSGERNQVIPPVHGPQRAPIARDRSQTSTQSKYSERGKKIDVRKTGLHGRLQSFAKERLCPRGGYLFGNACHEAPPTRRAFYKRFRDVSS